MRRYILLLSLLCGMATAIAAPNPKVVLHTTKGDITIELYPEKSPVTVANFLQYVRSGFYNDTLFHRVIPQFMIQGGGFGRDLNEKETLDPIPNESKENQLHNDRWSVAMARTDDPDSATSQFFINVRMNFKLDPQQGEPGYTVFGMVTDGQHVVREISLVPTAPQGGHANVPVEPVLIESAEVLP